ncbi:DNA polymerase III subunit alpha [Thermomonospora umbrina]|uniref:DNA polymerase III subunit alpha n=1 Tax=Thermomonospora umbrina TaxID=111806 RepID=A0A3D9SII3_9ACTN|nr:DNA polymerase III subunit alpha [Thermomonospora umbrina]REE95738.1 DNA polymerase III alpha subunit [Thermomonospora umbrina]
MGIVPHLHVASSFSLRYGVAPPRALAERAVELGMDLLALTDRDGLYGAVKHVVACRAAGITPILGADLAFTAFACSEGDGAAGRGTDGGLSAGRRPGVAGRGTGVRDAERPGRSSGGRSARAGGLPAGGAAAGGGLTMAEGAGGEWSGRSGGGLTMAGGGGGRPGGSGGAATVAGGGSGGRAVVLAAGGGGWGSLCRLVTDAHLSGERGVPLVGPEMLAERSEGLVVLLGPGSDVGRAVAERRHDLAERLLAGWRERAEVVIEIVDHRGRGDTARAARMLELAGRSGVPAVLTNAVRYLDRADVTAAQVLDAARKLVPLHRRHLEDTTGRAHLASAEEMWRVAERVCGPDRAAVRELMERTRGLGERCAIDPVADLGMGRAHLPEPSTEAGRAPHAELVARCAAGLVRRGLSGSARARDRLEHELGIIERKGLAAYFLVVAEAAGLIRSLGIRCAIRGSGAGCLVNHLLGIGDLNPLEHDLVMERFLSDGRKGLPDIDLDVESARRLEAYRAIFDRYGEERVACVSMMETYRARSAIRDVGNAVGLPPYEIDAIAKAFPHIRARQIRAALDDLPELRQSNLGQARLSGLFRIAERLDGLPRHIAMHPCGVLLSDALLRDRSPVERSLAGFPMSQFDKDDVEAMGMLKLDVLGVRMQSAMAHAVTEIARTGGGEVDLEAVPRDDEPTYAMIREARTLGCFQIESPGQRELVAKLLPRDLGDLVIDISLFRPGPVNSDMISPFLRARHGEGTPAPPHPDLADILEESGGVVVFHEQVLRIIDRMTGCGLSDAEAARRRLGDERGQVEVAAWFREHALARGYDEAAVERVWSTLSAFGAFGFCKAHAASFALPTYQSAWLKRHHPAAFYAGVLTHDPGMYPKRAILDDARHFGVPILPLDVNRSGAVWHAEPLSAGGSTARDTPPPQGIRVALNEVKGISEAEVDRIVEQRPYASLGDFWWRAHVSRPVAERLVLVGAFDALHDLGSGHRSRRDLLCQVGALDRAARTRRAGARTGVEGQLAFDAPEGGPETIPAGELPPMTPAEMVEAELEILGMDVSRHVLGFYDDLLAALGVVRARDLRDARALPAGAEVLVAGVKVATQTPAVRSGQRVIFATVDDATGPVDATFFESVQDRCAATVFGSWLLIVRGRLRRAGGRAVSLNGTDCWDLPRLHEEWRRGGIEAVHRAMVARPGPNGPRRGGRALVYANGFELSPYADVGPAGGGVKRPPRRLWHASGGSSGG